MCFNICFERISEAQWSLIAAGYLWHHHYTGWHSRLGKLTEEWFTDMSTGLESLNMELGESLPAFAFAFAFAEVRHAPQNKLWACWKADRTGRDGSFTGGRLCCNSGHQQLLAAVRFWIYITDSGARRNANFCSFSAMWIISLHEIRGLQSHFESSTVKQWHPWQVQWETGNQRWCWHCSPASQKFANLKDVQMFFCTVLMVLSIQSSLKSMVTDSLLFE